MYCAPAHPMAELTRRKNIGFVLTLAFPLFSHLDLPFLLISVSIPTLPRSHVPMNPDLLYFLLPASQFSLLASSLYTKLNSFFAFVL